MGKVKKTGITEEIIGAYEKNMVHIPLKQMGHFFTRAHRITKKKKHADIVAGNFVLARPAKIRGEIEALKKNEFNLPLKKPKAKRNRLRRELYEKNPRLGVLNELILDLFYIKSLSLESYMRKEFREASDILRKEDLRSLYLQIGTLRHDSSYAINSVFMLKHLGIEKIDQEAVAILKDYYFDGDLNMERKIPAWEFGSLVYSLTHVIIADSEYYQRTAAGHGWILDYFAKNAELIMKEATVDMVSEVALCYKLCGKEKEYGKAVEKFKSFLLEFFDSAKLEDIGYLVKKEHTNSILMILFSENKGWHRGPDLSGHEFFTKQA
ncbi:MAG: hypothetical protein UY41_C0007G0017 [Candidatus Moranbacteria bacterium GW2011_GWE1_49_15]|nr:MAG: hypothetical protein UX75_C0009G0032 [Candidatus Moranbacteria bacterium GW2011_GWE2_47_10]KKW07245.1 MAG: hypothetical protein UY41_C0007G0017 [Candidatus Moranbacteria bacterium GW2011_GWE1_49_15]HBP01579.1 hypothetical protein [Candidatus Moranbacteria bacterium]